MENTRRSFLKKMTAAGIGTAGLALSSNAAATVTTETSAEKKKKPAGKDDGKFFIAGAAQGRLLYNLRRQLVMGQAVSGENRKLLAADQCGKSVNGRNTGVDIISWIFPCYRV